MYNYKMRTEMQQEEYKKVKDNKVEELLKILIIE